MKKLLPLPLLLGLILLFSACSYKDIQTSIPGLNNLKFDPSLPTVKKLRTINSMSEIAIEWEPITERYIAGYRIFRSQNGKAYRLIKILPDRFTSHYTDTELKPNATYRYKVSLFTKDGRVSRTVTSDPTPTKGRVKPPVILEAISNLPNRIKVTWRVHENPLVKAYIVERRDEGKKSWKKVVILRNRLTVEYIDRGVIPGRTYYYRIRAKTYNGVVSAPSEIKSAHAKPLPKPITIIQATDNMPKQIQVRWRDPNPSGTIHHYNIYSSALKNGIYTFLGKTREQTYIDKINQDGVERYYQVTAIDYDGLESPKGVSVAKGRTMGYGKGPIIHSAVIRHNAIILTWTAPQKDIVSYTIVKKYWDGWRYKKLKIVGFKPNGTPVRFVDKKIKPNTKYTYYVIGVNSLKIPTEPSQAVTVEVHEITK